MFDLNFLPVQYKNVSFICLTRIKSDSVLLQVLSIFSYLNTLSSVSSRKQTNTWPQITLYDLKVWSVWRLRLSPESVHPFWTTQTLVHVVSGKLEKL